MSLYNDLKILLIEDDNIEVLKLKKAISREFTKYTLSLVKNVKEALLMIAKEFPDMILYDLDMSPTNGIDFLNIIKADENLNHIPVVFLTSSKNDKDIYNCYKLGIAGYIIKPSKYKDYEMKIKTIMDYWSHNEFLKL